jgi:hypothetical protein
VTTAVTSMHVEEYARMNIASVTEDPLDTAARGATRPPETARIAHRGPPTDARSAGMEISQLATGYQVLAATFVPRLACCVSCWASPHDESAAPSCLAAPSVPAVPSTLEDGARAVLDRRAADLRRRLSGSRNAARCLTSGFRLPPRTRLRSPPRIGRRRILP